MHPKIIYPGELAPLFEDLAKPLHERRRRDPVRKADPKHEVSLAHGVAIEPGDFAEAEHLEVLLDDLRRFLTVVMDVPLDGKGYLLRLSRGRPANAPEGVAEAHELRVDADGCEIVAEDMDGLRRAVVRLQDEMLLRQAPILPLGTHARWTRLKTRIHRSPLAPYRWLSGWELDHGRDYYPEAYLNRLMHYGINGIWVPALLRKFVASNVIPELGPEQHRLERLKALTAKAARYGIRVYLFLIEGRALPEGHPAGKAHPEILGARNALCTSEPLVREYIAEAMTSLFSEVSALAGVINIFCGERATNCWVNEKIAQECPRCRERSATEVHAETLDTFARGIRAASPTAEFLAWTYMMSTNHETRPIEPMLEVMRTAGPDVSWLGNFEHGTTKELCGKTVQIHEYSLSCVGPSEYFREMAKTTHEAGRDLYAKLQIGTSYEMSSVPYVPVPGIVFDKLRLADELGAKGAMLGWIPGGFPSPLLKMIGEAAFAPRGTRHEALRRVAAIEWGEAHAEEVVAAWETFAQAWQRYPFANAVLYWGPITRGPAYQLHLEREPRLAKPYNWGYNRKREPQPFEDQVDRWLGPYTVEEVTGSFREMAASWREGVARLKRLRNGASDDARLDRQIAVADAVRLQCLAAANVYEFYALRDRLREADTAEQSRIVSRMRAVTEDDLAVARAMKRLMQLDPTIGYESELFDYSFSIPLIDEKILQVCDLIPVLDRWQRSGVELEILDRTVEEAEALRPDRDPDRWGD